MLKSGIRSWYYDKKEINHVLGVSVGNHIISIYDIKYKWLIIIYFT